VVRRVAVGHSGGPAQVQQWDEFPVGGLACPVQGPTAQSGEKDIAGLLLERRASEHQEQPQRGAVSQEKWDDRERRQGSLDAPELEASSLPVPRRASLPSVRRVLCQQAPLQAWQQLENEPPEQLLLQETQRGAWAECRGAMSHSEERSQTRRACRRFQESQKVLALLERQSSLSAEDLRE
jgi:hypothetical protein